MTVLLWLGLAVAVPLPSGPPVGLAFHYRPGVFTAVARVRRMALDWSADGFASVPNCRYVNPAAPWYVLATVGGRAVRLEVLDCSDPRDWPTQRARGLVLETDWMLAHSEGWAVYAGDHGAGRAPAIVWGYTQQPGGFRHARAQAARPHPAGLGRAPAAQQTPSAVRDRSVSRGADPLPQRAGPGRVHVPGAGP